MNRIALTIVLALTGLFGLATAGPGYWSSTGPFGGFVYQIESDPLNASILYTTSNGGFYRSVDGGDTWVRADDGLGDARGRLRPTVDVDSPTNVYVFDSYSRLFRSTDRAVTWTATGFQSGIELPEGVWPMGLEDVPGSVGVLLMPLQVSPDAVPQPPPLMRSDDFGVTFTQAGSGLPNGGRLVALSFDPLTPSVALAIFSESQGVPLPGPTPFPPSIYRSSDGGLTWSPVYALAGDTSYLQPLQNGSISYGAGDTVYATANDGRIARSNDRGLTWATVPNAATAQFLLANPSNTDTFYYVAGRELKISSDGGNTATILSNGLSPNPSYLSTTTSLPVGSEIQALHADPGFPAPGTRLWLTTRGNGILRSSDLGSTWSPASEGLAAVNIRAIAVHPLATTASASQGLRIYGGFGDSFFSSPAMYRTNGLTSLQWQVQNQQLRAAQIRSIVIDPSTARPGSTFTAAHIYASGGPSQAPGYLNAGLYKSTNGGSLWSRIDAGLPLSPIFGGTEPWLGTVRQMALDLRSCEAEPRPPLPPCALLPDPGTGDPAVSPLRRVYASSTGHRDVSVPGTTTFTHRLLRSDDAGASWTPLDGNPGFTTSFTGTIEDGGNTYQITKQVIPLPIAISPSNPDRLFVGTFASVHCNNNTLNRTCDEAEYLALADPVTGVFRSNDRGATWTAVNNGLPRKTTTAPFVNVVADALTMIMHPTNHDILWVSMSDFEVTREDRSPPIYKTTDGGFNWVASSVGIPQGTDIRAMAVDPGDGNILYAAGAGTIADPGSVYRSDDGGLTWRSISIGLPAEAALAITVDPHNFNVLHAGTNTGVWSIEQLPDVDGDGIPDAVENFAPGGGDGNGDGVGDSTQGQVGSTIILFGLKRSADLKTAVADLLKGSGGGYVTTDVINGSGSCAQAVDVQNRLASRYGRDYLPGLIDYYRYPRDMVQFEIMQCAAATVDVTFHNADFDSTYGWSMRFYGPSTPGDDASMGWYDIRERAQRVAPNRWRLQLDANQFGSYRPVDDRIFFVGGPACYDDRILTADFEAVSTAKPGCI